MTIQEFSMTDWSVMVKPQVTYKGKMCIVVSVDEVEKFLYIRLPINEHDTNNEDDYRWVRYENCEIVKKWNMGNNKWPCVKCTAEQYEEIREQLLEWGFSDDDRHNIDNWEYFPVLQTLFLPFYKDRIGNWPHLYEDRHYLCPDIPTFMHACHDIAIREGWCHE